MTKAVETMQNPAHNPAIGGNRAPETESPTIQVSSQSAAQVTTQVTTQTTAKAAAQAPKAGKVPLILRLIRGGFALLGKISPRLAGQLAFKMWIRPPRYPQPAFEREMIKSGRQKTLEINGQNIATYHWGYTGPRVLLVHGWSGRGPQIATFVPALLDMGYQVIALDAPAHGSSDGKQTNMYQIADSILGLEKLTGGFAAIITHSFGGPVIAKAMKEGLTTGCIVNIAPPSTTIGLVDKFSDTLHLGKRIRNALVENIEKRFGATVWQESAMVENVRKHDLPVLVIHDTDDLDVPWQEGRDVAAAWPDAKLVTTSGLGHRRILKDENVIQATVEFVKQHARIK